MQEQSQINGNGKMYSIRNAGLKKREYGFEFRSADAGTMKFVFRYSKIREQEEIQNIQEDKSLTSVERNTKLNECIARLLVEPSFDEFINFYRDLYDDEGEEFTEAMQEAMEASKKK